MFEFDNDGVWHIPCVAKALLAVDSFYKFIFTLDNIYILELQGWNN
jgi:hypothetical protein